MKKTGMTLVEILIVVIIIGILAGVATVCVGTATAAAKDATRKNDMVRLEKQLELYRVQHGDTYPWEWDDVGDDLDLIVAQLTQRTNEFGEVMPEGGSPRNYKCGPYLDKFPLHLFTGDDKSAENVTFDDVITFEDDSGDGTSSNTRQTSAVRGRLRTLMGR